FPAALREFSCTLLFYSASAYEYVCNKFIMSLPHPKSIRKWYSKIDFSPGISLQVLNSIKKYISENAANEKKLQFGLIKKNQIERPTLVFMLVAFKGHFKTSIAYYLIRSLRKSKNYVKSLKICNKSTEIILVLNHRKKRFLGKQIAGNAERGGKPFETKFMESKQKNKREYSDDEDDDNDKDDDDDDNDTIPTQITAQSSMEQINKKETIKRHARFVHNSFHTNRITTTTTTLSTPQGHHRLQSQLGPLGQVYVNILLTGNETKNEIDFIYGVYFDENSMMLGNKKFDIDTDDTIIIDGVRNKGTPGLYELIFKKIPNDAIYTENDKQTYKHILLMMNAHRRDNNVRMPIKSNKGHKYKNIIAPLLVTYKTSSTSIDSGIKTNIPSAAKLTMK
ncbi:THAP domain-containing protein 9, partial [Trachymyrmex septentrionalis]